MRLDTGVCVSCLLREGLETRGEVSKGVYETVLDELDARDKPWQLGNYEILEQIGYGNLSRQATTFPTHRRGKACP
jgi:hypothetical protein